MKGVKLGTGMDWSGTRRAIARGVKRKGMEGYNNPEMNDTPKISSGTLVNKGVKIIGGLG